MTVRRLPRFVALGVVVAATGLSACGGGGGAAATATTTTTPPAVVASAPAPVDPTTPAPAVPTATVARADHDLEVFAEPDAPQPQIVLPATTSFGTARALLVTDQRDEWLHVLLPVRPNGSSGWIRSADVTRRRVELRIDVDLTARTLTVTDHGAPVLTTPIAVGAPDVPTPAGDFFVVDKLETGAAAGPYGPYALGLSAHSDVLSEFGGGDGQIGIHGTNDPSSIGQAVSHGCVRVPNDVTEALNGLIPLGTPVSVHS